MAALYIVFICRLRGMVSCYGKIYIYIYNTGSYATITTLILFVDICIIRVYT